jgi:hypothetical protein
MQDTATQAMTEVALGLSMAFFALLILALISVSLPNNADSSELKAQPFVPIDQQIALGAGDQKSTTNNDSGDAQRQAQTIILYWEGQYFDLQHQAIDIKTMSNLKHEKQAVLIVAVPAACSLDELLAIQSVFDGHDIKLTKLSSEWQTVLRNGRAE